MSKKEISEVKSIRNPALMSDKDVKAVGSEKNGLHDHFRLGIVLDVMVILINELVSLMSLVLLYCSKGPLRLTPMEPEDEEFYEMERETMYGDENVLAMAKNQCDCNETCVALRLKKRGLTCAGIQRLSTLLLQEQTPCIAIDLSMNSIKDDGAKDLARVLRCRNVPVKYLNLKQNQISDTGLSALAEALTDSTSLEAIDLQGNALITDTGAKRLLKSIRTHPSIQEINLEGTQVSAKMQESIKHQLESLHSKRALLLVMFCHHSKRSSGRFLTVDLIRKLDETLFDKQNPKATLCNSLESMSMKIIRFVLVQTCLCACIFLLSKFAKDDL